jgi:hypothetical protein
MRKTAAVLAAIGLAAWLAGCSSGENLDPRELADALSEEFTSELEFENGSEQDGPPPDEHAEDINYPQIGFGGINSPLTVVYDNWFDITLQSFFTPDTEVVGAIVHIEQANKTDVSSRYIEVIPNPPALLNNTMTLRARVMSPSTRLGGNMFKLRIALLRDDGAGLRGVGNYATIYLLTPQVGATAPKVPQCTCEAGTISVVGSCTDTSVQDELANSPCTLWASSLTEFNSDPIAHQDAEYGAEMPAGTRAETWWVLPRCTVELECP